MEKKEKSNSPKKVAAETHMRSLIKAVSYRVLGSLATAGIVWIYSRKLSAAATAGLLDSVIKIGLYFIHERIWDGISFGKASRGDDYSI